MVTLYQLLGVDENASKEAIKNSYEARIGHPALDEKRKNQLKIAVDILLNDAKREKYNKDLAEYRAQELLKSVEVKEEETINYNDLLESVNETTKKDVVVENNISEKVQEDVQEPQNVEESSNVYNEIFDALEENQNASADNANNAATNNAQRYSTMSNKEKELREIENRINEQEYQKILKKQKALDEKERKRAEKEYKEKYKEAYVTELRNRGYDVKYPWTWKRVRNLIVGIATLIFIGYILWQISAVKETLIDLYNENFIVKAIVDIIKSIFQAVASIFKSN